MTSDEFGNETCQVLTGGIDLITAAGDWVIIEDDLMYIVIEDGVMLLQTDDDEVLRHYPSGSFIIEDLIDGG